MELWEILRHIRVVVVFGNAAITKAIRWTVSRRGHQLWELGNNIDNNN